MAFLFKKGSFTSNAGTGTQDITDVGFQPIAYMLISTNSTAEGITAAASFSKGITDGTTSRCVAWAADDVANPSNAARSWTAKVVTILASGTPTTAAEADHSAFLANGFRLNWTTAAARLVHYVAWGGSDIPNAKVTEHTMSTLTGNQSYTGVGFQGEWFYFLSAQTTAAGTAVHGMMSVGSALSASKRWAYSLSSEDAITMSASMDSKCYQSSSFCLSGLTSAGAIDYELDFVSPGSDGFTFNQSNAPAAAYLFASLALKGGSYDIGTYTKCTTASCVDTISLTFAPVGILLHSNMRTAGNNVSGQYAWGGSDGTAEGTAFAICRDGLIPAESERLFKTDKALGDTNWVGSILDEADATLSASPAQFTTTWTTNGGNSSDIGWAAFGNAPITGWIPPTNQPYRENPQIVTY